MRYTRAYKEELHLQCVQNYYKLLYICISYNIKVQYKRYNVKKFYNIKLLFTFVILIKEIIKFCNYGMYAFICTLKYLLS